MDDLVPDWLTPAEAAAALGLSIRSIHRFMRDRRIAAVKLSARRTRISRAELARFIRTLPPRPAAA